jgi:hypothetical protein
MYTTLVALAQLSHDLIAPRAKPVLLQHTRRAFTAENRKKQCQRSAAITECTSVFCTEPMCLPYTRPLLGQVLNHHVLGLSLLREALVSLPQDCHKVTARFGKVAPARRLLAGRVSLFNKS